jgi:hypothetical protein
MHRYARNNWYIARSNIVGLLVDVRSILFGFTRAIRTVWWRRSFRCRGVEEGGNGVTANVFCAENVPTWWSDRLLFVLSPLLTICRSWNGMGPYFHPTYNQRVVAIFSKVPAEALNAVCP